MHWIDLKWSSVVYSIDAWPQCSDQTFHWGYTGDHDHCVHYLCINFYELWTSKICLLLQVKVAVVRLIGICCHCHCDHPSFFSSVGNIEIITKSVGIVFICDLDELLYAILNFYPGWVKIIFQEEQIVSESDLFRTWWWSWGWFGRNWGKCKVGRQSGKFWGGGSNFQPKHETFARTQSRLDKTFCCDKNRDEEEKQDEDILESRLGCVVSQFDLA